MVDGSPGTATTSGVVSRSSEILCVAIVFFKNACPVRSRTCLFGVSLDAQSADTFGRFGLDVRVGFRKWCALARLATQRPASGAQRTGRNEMPAFPKAVAPKCDRQLRKRGHEGVGTCGTLPFTSAGAGAGSFNNPCKRSSGTGKTIVLFFSAAISVRVCRYRSCSVAG